jgi:prefoldin subunit 5
LDGFVGPTKKEMAEKIVALEKRVGSLEYMEGHHSKNLQKVYKKMEEMEKKIKEWEEEEKARGD